MKTNIFSIVLAVIFLGSTWVEFAFAQPHQLEISESLKIENAFGVAMFDLAGERFENNLKNGEWWILRIHKWTPPSDVIKIKCRNVFVVSIPVVVDDDEGYRNYVAHYNGLCMNAADNLVERKDFEQAKAI